MLGHSLTLLALAASALASISITNPVASSSFKGGQTLKVSWLADTDKATPLAASFGNSSVSIYTGSSTVQTFLQAIGTVDPAKTKSVSAKIDKTIGPSTALYFIRIESLAAKDAAGNPLEAFSARFALTGMTGKWTAAEASANSDVALVAAATTASTKKTTKSKVSTATKAVSVVATTASVVPIKIASSVPMGMVTSATGVVAPAVTSAVSPLSASSAARANASATAASSGSTATFAPLGWKVVVALGGVAATMMLM